MITVHKNAETIQGRNLYEEIRYTEKFQILFLIVGKKHLSNLQSSLWDIYPQRMKKETLMSVASNHALYWKSCDRNHELRWKVFLLYRHFSLITEEIFRNFSCLHSKILTRVNPQEKSHISSDNNDPRPL